MPPRSASQGASETAPASQIPPPESSLGTAQEILQVLELYTYQILIENLHETHSLQKTLITASTPNGWVVRWWRENQYPESEANPGERSTVDINDLRDSLWMDRPGRRAIKLGLWTRTWDLGEPEDILLDPESIPYSQEVDEILAPFQDLLSNLFRANFEALEDNHIPAKDWLESQKKNLLQPVPYSGPLSILERARIANWFETKISKNKSKKARSLWNGLLPLAHAITIFIAASVTHEDLFEREKARLESQNKKIDPNIQFGAIDYLNEAWRRQRTQVPRDDGVDVDLECLRRLEEEMFEVSMRAGPAGNHQWGLDAGSHQDRWWPYKNLPSHLNDGTRDGDKYWDECEPGPDFKELPERVEAPKGPRPRPTMITKKNSSQKTPE